MKYVGPPHKNGRVVSGSLQCTSCGADFPIINGIPRFVKPEEDYCGNFGYQWQEWGSIQIDHLSAHKLSHDRFLADTRWEPDWLNGKLILDAGCGAGRFSDIAGELGARVIAIDISTAIDTCRATTARHDDRANGGVDCIQASLFDLPLRRDIFDAIYCMGVIQHTPHPTALMTGLPTFLKPGAQLFLNFYEEGVWRRLQIIKYSLRLVTPFLPINVTWALSKILVTLLFPLTAAIARIPKIKILNHIIPIAAVHNQLLTLEQQRTWTLLDTFDWYGARFEKRQYHTDVAKILADSGMVRISTEPGLAWCHKPTN
ncbi:MAG: hypothetical protein CBB68_07040 [Rhodospirillaceae bacterium TMED8]|nr:hypothetical protein [Magnetovibrio sp.]OUT50749.1 MAG: hypothetical protein CBB68_07040 [Rhodospirillaceae bacterium TMED8]